jgi:hypothetical protein
MKFSIRSFFLGAMMTFASIAALATDGVEKVDIYYGHFLLQSWPQNKRTINIEVDPALPADTLFFYATGLKGGLTQTTLQIKNMQGATIDEIYRVNPKSDGTKATFFYVLNQTNLSKIKDPSFKVIIDDHQYNTPEIHEIALIFITRVR